MSNMQKANIVIAIGLVLIVWGVMKVAFSQTVGPLPGEWTIRTIQHRDETVIFVPADRVTTKVSKMSGEMVITIDTASK